jgi:hypothetical protein
LDGIKPFKQRHLAVFISPFNPPFISPITLPFTQRVTGGIRERYGRDEKDLSHAKTLLYKGDSNDDGRDGEIFQCLTLLRPKKNPRP